jgi:5-methylcytosine-specific restriction endonuclease McrA
MLCPSQLCRKCRRAKEKEREKRTNAVGQLKRKSLINERGNKCEICAATGTLHAHHIKAVKDGGDDSSQNIQLVCPSCHKDIHKAGGRNDR